MLIRFEPLDTLFFRDGRPYNQGENTQTGVLSRFPPSPKTLVGALRAAWARAMGWSGQGRWPQAIRCRLGGDGDELDAGISFRGPILVEDSGSACFPLPASVIGLAGARASDPMGALPSELALLRPAKPPGLQGYECDLGAAVQLPAGPDDVEGRKALDDVWLDAEGLEQVLAGRIPDSVHLRSRKALWQIEPRVAIERNHQSRSTEQGVLYSPLMVRLNRGVTLAMFAEGMPEDEQVLAAVSAVARPVGGESRSCWIQIDLEGTQLPLPARPKLFPTGKRLHYSVFVATPWRLPAAPRPGRESVPGLPGNLVSACLPRPQSWGGWCTPGRRPLPLQPHLAPGSVLFLECADGKQDEVEALHGTTIGQAASWGYGLVFIGTW